MGVAMMSLAAFLHPLVQPAPKPAPVPAGVVPRCGARDWLSGAVCNVVEGHHDGHASTDRDFEIKWPRA